MPREGLIAVEREVTRAGQVHTQRFWVREGGFKDKLTGEGAAAVEDANPEEHPERFDENVERVFQKKVTPEDLRQLMRPPAGYSVKIDHVRDDRSATTVRTEWTPDVVEAAMSSVRERFVTDYPGEEMPDDDTIRMQATANLGLPRAKTQYSPAVLVAASLLDDTGRQVGTITRQFIREPTGELTVHHVGLFLDDDQQHKGVGAAITRNSFEEYRKIGVSKVTMEAASVGRYTWARFGFNWPKERADYVRQHFPAALRDAGVPREEAQAIADRHADRAWEIASIKVGERKVGKYWLLNDLPYKAELSLRDGDPGFEVAKGRLGL